MPRLRPRGRIARGERKRGDGRVAVVTMEMGERKKVGGGRKCMMACSTGHTSDECLRRCYPNLLGISRCSAACGC